MRRSAWLSILAVALLLVATAPNHAWAWRGHPGVRARVFVGVGPIWWGPPYPYWYYPPPPYYAYPPSPVIVQEPPVYVRPEPAPAAPPQSYWYYCPGAKAYYPSVQTCAEAWIPVPPRSQ